jgi:hypothetical protein
MRLTIDIFAPWLQDKVDNYPDIQFKVTYGRQDDTPDRLVTIFNQGPGADVHEGAFEDVPFRFLVRGLSERLANAQLIAYTLDDIMDNVANEMMGPVYVTEAYVINKPRQLPMPDKNSRYQFMADYMVRASKQN